MGWLAWQVYIYIYVSMYIYIVYIYVVCGLQRGQMLHSHPPWFSHLSMAPPAPRCLLCASLPPPQPHINTHELDTQKLTRHPLPALLLPLAPMCCSPPPFPVFCSSPIPSPSYAIRPSHALRPAPFHPPTLAPLPARSFLLPDPHPGLLPAATRGHGGAPHLLRRLHTHRSGSNNSGPTTTTAHRVAPTGPTCACRCRGRHDRHGGDGRGGHQGKTFLPPPPAPPVHPTNTECEPLPRTERGKKGGRWGREESWVQGENRIWGFEGVEVHIRGQRSVWDARFGFLHRSGICYWLGEWDKRPIYRLTNRQTDILRRTSSHSSTPPLPPPPPPHSHASTPVCSVHVFSLQAFLTSTACLTSPPATSSAAPTPASLLLPHRSQTSYTSAHLHHQDTGYSTNFSYSQGPPTSPALHPPPWQAVGSSQPHWGSSGQSQTVGATDTGAHTSAAGATERRLTQDSLAVDSPGSGLGAVTERSTVAGGEVRPGVPPSR